MRLDSFRPVGLLADPITRTPIIDEIHSLDHTGRRYDIFDIQGAVLLFRTGEDRETGIKDEVFLVKIYARGNGFLKGPKAREVLARLTKEFPRVEPAKKEQAATA